MTAYCNEIEPYAVEWLQNLILCEQISDGHVDPRSILDVRPNDLAEYTRCHFFAGVGVWDYALRLAGWPDDVPVWTGSCPCQPFSAAGRQLGFTDERHLWPAWYHLIGECHPSIIFGEQVASGVAGDWIDLVQSDLEALGYFVGAVAFPACSVGAPHIRQRLYWVAYNSSTRPQRGERAGQRTDPQRSTVERSSDAGALADDDDDRREGLTLAGLRRTTVHDADGRGAGFVGHTAASGRTQGAAPRSEPGGQGHGPLDASALEPWRDLEWLPCRDGKARPTQPGLQPLAHGATSRVGRLRAYGNAIVAPQAATFIRTVMEHLGL